MGSQRYLSCEQYPSDRRADDRLSAVCSDPSFPKLNDAVLSRSCIAFVGAGLSTPEYPLWPQLVTTLCKECGVEYPDESTLSQLAELAKKKDPDRYVAHLRDVFQRKDPQYRHVYLVKCPFAGFVTTNYDHFIEQAQSDLHSRSSDVFSYPHLPTDTLGKEAVHHIHGHVAHDQEFELVLTSSEYERAYSQESLLDAILKGLIYKHVCFIGCSLNDEYLRPMLGRCNRIRSHLKRTSGHPPYKWFMLTDREETTPVETQTIGIVPVRYDRRTGDHQGLTDILKYWSHSPKPNVRQAFDEPPYRDPQELPK